MLADYGVDRVQGYHIGHPVKSGPPDELRERGFVPLLLPAATSWQQS